MELKLRNVVMVGIEKCDNYVDEDCAVEENVCPERHERGNPEECWLTSQLLLPFHLVEHWIEAFEEIGNLEGVK